MAWGEIAMAGLREFYDRDGRIHHDEFQTWRARHPHGFFLTFRAGFLRFPSLHGARCPVFLSTDQTYKRTGRSFTTNRKVCGFSERELRKWARDRRFYAPSRCGYCIRYGFISGTVRSEPSRRPKRRLAPNLAPDLDRVATALEQKGDFDPTSLKDAREKGQVAIVRRQGQPAFRSTLLAAYQGRCAVTGCAVTEVLEAAHIFPYRGRDTNHVCNGLLLRADLHTLFDLGLLAVNEKTHTLIVAASLRSTDYARWRGKRIRLPRAAADCPSGEALRLHRQDAAL